MSEKRIRPDERGVPEIEALEDVSIFYDMKRSFDGATSAPAEWRHREACNLLGHALDIAASMCGSEVLELAYGEAKSSERKDQLLVLADRLRWPALLFAGIKVGDRNASFEGLGVECESVARGDAPSLLAKLPGYRKNVRLIVAKFQANRLDSYLSGLGISTNDRHEALANAYTQEWDTMSRWSSDAASTWGTASIEEDLRKQRYLGKQHLQRIGEIRDEHWRPAVERAGRVFKRQAGYPAPTVGRK